MATTQPIPQPMPINLQIFKQIQQKIAVGCKGIDTMLGGGFPTGMITELCGESASGKTQICLQLSLLCQLPPSCGGLFGSCIYIHSNNNFPANRLVKIANYMKENYINESSYINIDDVKVMRVDNPSDLLTAIKNITILCKQAEQSPRNVRLIIVDSIASIFQCAFNNNHEDMTSRSKLFFKISAELRGLAHNYNAAVVCTNEVRATFVDNTHNTNNIRLLTSGIQVEPALGLSWSNCINNRFFLGIHITNGERIRHIRTIMCPYLGDSITNFKITSGGVEDLI